MTGAAVGHGAVEPVIDAWVERHFRVELDRPILENVSFRVERGEHWALVGANGSGKSTLLAIVTGDLWPSIGSVRVLGAEYGKVDKRELRKRFGVVSAALFQDLPGRDVVVEVVASGVHARIGWLGPLAREDLDRARRALARLGATALADRTYGVLSQGEKQRVMIARALVSDPGLLVLDEAAGGLDPIARERFLSDLQDLAMDPEGPTQLHVTHHLEEIPGLVTHALVLSEGRVIGSGPVREVLTSRTLTAAFGVDCRVDVLGLGAARRFRLRVEGAGGRAALPFPRGAGA